MDTVITFTPATLVAGILAICAGISCVAAAIGWIVKGVHLAKAPAKRTEERLVAIETTLKEHDNYLSNDRRRLEDIEDGNRVTQKAILALLSHGIDGNDTEALRKAKNELEAYLIDRTSADHNN